MIDEACVSETLYPANPVPPLSIRPRRVSASFLAPLASEDTARLGVGSAPFSAALAGVIRVETHMPSIAMAATADHLQREPQARGPSGARRSIVRSMVSF